MKNKVILSFLLLILAGCALNKSEKQAPPVVYPNPAPKTVKIIGETRAIFHVIEPLNVELILKKSGQKNEHTVLMDKTLSQLALEPGYWQIQGYILNGKSYRTLTSKKFVFFLKKNQVSYVGSYIFQCPKVNNSHLSEMKKMSFFNRYPYRSNTGLCEMVVGNDYKVVNKVWLELAKEHRPLRLAF